MFKSISSRGAGGGGAALAGGGAELTGREGGAREGAERLLRDPPPLYTHHRRSYNYTIPTLALFPIDINRRLKYR